MDKGDIAVLGRREFVLGFDLVGVQKTYEKDGYREQVEDLLSEEEVAILVLDERDVEELPARIQESVRSSVSPVVVTLSESADSGGINDKINKVIGADITG